MQPDGPMLKHSREAQKILQEQKADSISSIVITLRNPSPVCLFLIRVCVDESCENSPDGWSQLVGARSKVVDIRHLSAQPSR